MCINCIYKMSLETDLRNLTQQYNWKLQDKILTHELANKLDSITIHGEKEFMRSY